MKTVVILVMSCFLIISCQEEGKIKIQNKLPNTILDNISFGNIPIYATLLPGETSSVITVSDYKESFPKINQLVFYMESNGNKVYLQTKTKFKLEYGETLLITISDSTEVINPLLK